MRRLFDLVRPHWKLVMLAVMCSAIVSAVNGAFAWFAKYAVDDVFVDRVGKYLFPIAITVVVLFTVRGVFIFLQNVLMARVGGRIVRDTRRELFGHMIYLPMSHFGTDTAGSMMSRVINDVGMLDKLVGTSVRDLFFHSGTIVFLVAVALYRRWDLTLIALVGLPGALYVTSRIGKRLKAAAKQAQIELAHITESLSEGISGIKVIKSFTAEKKETDRFYDRSEGYFNKYMKTSVLSEMSGIIMEAVGGLGIALMFIYCGRLVLGGSMTPGDFISFVAAMLMIFVPAKRLAQVYNGLQQSRAYIERIDAVLKTGRENDGTRQAPPISKDIVFDNVRFRYPGREEDALKGLSLTVRKGEVIALVGRSGSGKTTLMDMLARFYTPREGRILIDGVDINEFTAESLRGQIASVSQHVILFNGSVADNIRYGRDGASEAEVRRAAEMAFAHDFIMEQADGYGYQIGDSGMQLSGGQRQRVAIARAILKDAPILVLDEATSALDSQSEHMVQRALDRMIEEGGHKKTIFVIAHRLSTIRRADRIVVMDNGMIEEAGSHDELLAKGGLYSKLHSLQHGGVLDLDAPAL